MECDWTWEYWKNITCTSTLQVKMRKDIVQARQQERNTKMTDATSSKSATVSPGAKQSARSSTSAVEMPIARRESANQGNSTSKKGMLFLQYEVFTPSCFLGAVVPAPDDKALESRSVNL